MKKLEPRKEYLIKDFTKDELEANLKFRTVKFWTKDCSIMPDFKITAPVTGISYFNNGEIAISILKKKTGRSSKEINLSSNMVNLKFMIMSD